MSSSRYCCISCWISGNRAWTRISTWGMRFEARWIELIRKNQVKKYFSGQNYGPQLSKLHTAILGLSTLLRNGQNCGPQLLGLEAWIFILKVIFHRDQKQIKPPSSQTSLNTLKNWSEAKKKRRTPLEKMNSRTG
jgi:hypothetical protein